MKQLINILFLTMLLPSVALSQGVIDAFHLSSHQISGTARSAAMGNAFGALGGDFTSLSINPAGIAVYRSSELVFTPTFNINKTESMLGGSIFSEEYNQFKLNNIGFVGTYTSKNDHSGIVSFNFGIGYNTIMDFDNNSFAEFNSSPSSFLDGIANWANSEALFNEYLNRDINDIWFEDWPAKLAWETFLIDPYKDENEVTYDQQYVSVLYEDELVDQQKVVEHRGDISEFVLSGGLNINHQLYLGATVGIQDVNLTQLTAYREFLEDGHSFTYYDDLYIDGSGYNLKLGAIFKPVNSLRIGLAYHTPTYYVLSEENILDMDASLADTYSADEGINLYDYDFRTPSKVIVSAALVLGKKAIISVDGEYQDYSSMKFKNGGTNGQDDFEDVNNEIKGVYESVFNVRLGGEYKLSPQVSLRAGYETFANPFNPSETAGITAMVDNSSTMSFGLGYTSGKFFTDVAYRQATSNYSVYNIQPNMGAISLENVKSNLMLTLGFRF